MLLLWRNCHCINKLSDCWIICCCFDIIAKQMGSSNANDDLICITSPCSYDVFTVSQWCICASLYTPIGRWMRRHENKSRRNPLWLCYWRSHSLLSLSLKALGFLCLSLRVMVSYCQNAAIIGKGTPWTQKFEGGENSYPA